MGFIHDWLGLESKPHRTTESESTTIREIARKLEEMPRDQARYLAAFAYLLGRVAHADLEISDKEMATMERIVQEQAELPEELAILVIQMARSQNLLLGGTEDYLVAREFKRMSSLQQRKKLLRCLFSVASSDGTILVREDNEIRRISQELGIGHPDFISIRLSFRDYLAVLQDEERGSTGEA